MSTPACSALIMLVVGLCIGVPSVSAQPDSSPPPPGPALPFDPSVLVFPVESTDSFASASASDALDLLVRNELSNVDSRRTLAWAAEEGDPSLVPQLWAVADTYRESSFGHAERAFYALLELGVPPSALITYVEERAPRVASFPYESADGRELRNTLGSAIHLAATRPDSSLLLRVETLGRTYPFLVSFTGSYRNALLMESRWAAMRPAEAAYQMAFHTDIFVIPREDGTLSHPYFGPQSRAHARGVERSIQAAEALVALAAREPAAAYAGIDRWADERVARLTPWQRERYLTYQGVPLREAVRSAILDFAGLPDRGR